MTGLPNLRNVSVVGYTTDSRVTYDELGYGALYNVLRIKRFSA